MEVKPGSPRTEDIFLHLIQVGDQSLQTMSDAKTTTGHGVATVTFDTADKTATLSFATTGNTGGHVTLTRGDEMLVDRALTNDVAPQAGLAGDDK